MYTITLPSVPLKVKHQARPHRLSPRHQQLADQSWRLCQPALSRIRKRCPHSAELIAAILQERITLAIPGYHPDRLTLREWCRKQIYHSLVAAACRADRETADTMPISA